MPKRIFSGIQPSGETHIGNYFGAIANWVNLQDQKDNDCIYCIVDYHALSGETFGEELRANTLKMATLLLACGIDPEQVTFFVQSDVPEHTELAWILNTITPIAELERMTQFKDKSQDQAKNINAGLFDYPVLQAADILLYHAQAIPVGADQLQHIEMSRLLARKFNKKFGELFVEPEALVTPAARLMSLTAPDKKMSKSHGAKSYISVLDAPEVIRQKISKAITDTGAELTGSGKAGKISSGVENLIAIFSAIDTKKGAEYLKRAQAGDLPYSELKSALADALIEFLVPIQERYAELSADPARVREVLETGGKRARHLAQENLKEIRKMVGLG